MTDFLKEIPKSSGIYCIYNIKTKTYYVGQSVNIYNRLKVHLCYLRKHKSCNAHLLNAYKKYGEAVFETKVLELVEPDITKLTEAEQRWCDTLIEQGFELYNTRECSDSNLGIKHTEETKEKHKELSKGDKNPASKLTEEQAIELLTTDSTLTYKEAVKKYGVSRACIKDLWQRRSWEHLNYPKVIHEDEPEYRSGENHPLSQLTEEQAIAILTTDKDLTVNECCEKYKVNRIVIEQLRHRTTWKHLDYPAITTKDLNKATGSSNGNSKLDDLKVNLIKRALEDGRSCCSIGKEFGVSNVSVANIRDGKIWKHVK